MSTLELAIYTEVEPATDQHGTQVVARAGHFKASVPNPYEFSDWADIHGVAVQALLERRGKGGMWIPALFGAGVIWVAADQLAREFKV